MKFAQPLTEGTFKRRYKRFFADVEYAGETLVAHVPNTGSMQGCNIPESSCRFSRVDNPARKLAYTLEMVRSPTSWVGVNTGRSNALVWELWESGLYAPWAEFDRAQREVKLNAQTRIDMVMWRSQDFAFAEKQRVTPELISESGHKFHILEIKNVSLADAGVAYFPDAVTARGQKHILELVNLIEAGHSAEIVFTVQRQDCQVFSPAEHIDPRYAQLLRAAMGKGLRVSALPCHLSDQEIRLLPSPLDFRP